MLAGADELQPVGIVGDASATAGQSRSGEDTRRRGWFWHWNSIVTQFAPIIGLKGVGLLNSYTVWTDRRENSPHRGFAFPSQQSEADFYGEDRNELITINKILVALDLIEIRKEMVPRTDAQGRRWKVPHNLYRVKDHGDEFNLTTDDVRRVVALADKDRAVYRYVRRIFSPKFAPIDRDNVWHDILEELRPTATWQKLAARTIRDEDRASARTKAGHASRKAATSEDSGAFSLPNGGDTTAFEATARNSSNDSVTDDTKDSGHAGGTIAESTNNGSRIDVAKSNNGLTRKRASADAPINTGEPTIVAPSSTTYYQDLTTTTTDREKQTFEPIDGGAGPGSVPDDRREKEVTVRLFDEANGRVSTVAARRQLDRIAESVSELAGSAGVSGWALVGSAIEEAVSSGSAFVAPKRIREILTRWDRDGVPAMYARSAQDGAAVARPVTVPVTSGEGASHRNVRTAGGAAMFPVDRDPADIWETTCDLLKGSLSATAIGRLRNGVVISGYEAGLVYLTPSTIELGEEIANGWGEMIQRKLGVVLRRPLRIKVVPPELPDGDEDARSTHPPRAAATVGARSHARPEPPRRIPVFMLPECGMTSTQVWMAVLDDLRASGAIPKAEVDAWLRDSVLLGRSDAANALVVGVPHALAERRAARFLAAIETATMHIVGFDCTILIVRTQEWLSGQDEGTGTEG